MDRLEEMEKKVDGLLHQVNIANPSPDDMPLMIVGTLVKLMKLVKELDERVTKLEKPRHPSRIKGFTVRKINNNKKV